MVLIAEDTNSLSKLFIPSTAIGSTETNPTSCIVLESRVFEIFIIADEPFEKALRILETWELFNYNLQGHHKNYKSHLLKDLKFLQDHFLSLILSY